MQNKTFTERKRYTRNIYEYKESENGGSKNNMIFFSLQLRQINRETHSEQGERGNI